MVVTFYDQTIKKEFYVVVGGFFCKNENNYNPITISSYEESLFGWLALERNYALKLNIPLETAAIFYLKQGIG